MLKTQTFFAHPITKPPASTLEFKNFDSVLQKKLCDPRKKQEKRPHPAGSCAWAGLWPAVMSMLSTSRSFQTFLKHNVGNPVLLLSPPLTLIDSNPWPVGYNNSTLTPNLPLLLIHGKILIYLPIKSALLCWKW